MLRSDRELLFLPLLSFVSMMFVLYACVVLLQVAGIRLPAGHGSDAAQAMQSNPALYAWLFVYYLVTYFVIFFFNTALVGAALERLNGGNPTVGSALALALQRIGPIFGYALVSATVGVLMALVVERVAGILGRLVGAGLTMAWTIATFLVVPIMAAEGVGPVAAIEESAGLVRRTWGENLIGNVGISLAMSAIGGAIVFLGLACGLAADVRGYPGLAVPIMIATGLPVRHEPAGGLGAQRHLRGGGLLLCGRRQDAVGLRRACAARRVRAKRRRPRDLILAGAAIPKVNRRHPASRAGGASPPAIPRDRGRRALRCRPLRSSPSRASMPA